MLPAMRTPRRFGSLQLWQVGINRMSPQAQGLVAAWPFGAGLVLPDIAGFRNPLTASNVAAYVGSLESGPGMPYTEEDSGRTYNVRNTAPLGVPAANATLSISLWNYVVTATGKQSLFGYGDPTGVTGWNLQHVTGGNSGVYNAANGNTIVEAASPANEWTHIAYTFDGTTSRLYFNGQEKANAGTALPGSTVNQISLHQNIHPTFPENAGGGNRIADARLYSVALAPAVVWQMFDRATRHDLFCLPGRNRRSLVDPTIVAEALPPGIQLISVP